MGKMAVSVQLVGLGLLVVGIWFGYRQWIRPHDATINPQGRGLLLLVVSTLMGGLIGSPFWWMDQPFSFSWDLPPLASRMLAAAGLSFFTVSLLVLRHPTYRRLRLILILLFVYLAPLVLGILLFHLNRFDFAMPITYGFFAIAIPMTLATTWYLLRQPQIINDEVRDSVAASVVIQVWLCVVATISGFWGPALIVTDSGPTSLIWAWPDDLLSSRLIGVMLMTIAAGSLYSFRFADTAWLMMGMILVYSLGLTLAAAWNAFFGLPINPLYAAVFSVIALVTSVLFRSAKQARSQRPISARPVATLDS
jgi:hypothetical protein